MKKTCTSGRHTNRILTTVLTVVLAVSCCLITDSCKTEQRDSARFNRALNNATDEELFLVLQYAITQEYVPTHEKDPCENVNVFTSHWYKTKQVYEKIADRTDLLQQLYPDVEVLRNYVFEWYDPNDSIVKQTILRNIQQNCPNLDSLIDPPHRLRTLKKRFRF